MLDRFIQKARATHGDRYDYSKVEYVNKDTNVVIVCSVHGDFEQTPANHYKHGCWKCHFDVTARQQRGNHGASGVRADRSDVIAKFRKAHGERYGYDKVQYQNNKTRVIITCPEHGDFEQTPVNHLAGKGCRTCYTARLATPVTDFVQEARAVHGDRYDYSRVQYRNTDSKVAITCPAHGDFEQTPAWHLKGNGCPTCSTRVSKAETEIYDYLRTHYGGRVIQRNTRSVIEGFELDLYLPALKLAVEYCGLYWHSEQQLKARGQTNYYHLEKLRACRARGIRLLTIFEDEWLNRRDVIESKLLYELKAPSLRRVHARKCSVVTVDASVKNQFMDANHLQQRDLTAAVSVGLEYDGEVVACMTFGRPNVSGGGKAFDWNLSRFAIKRGYVVSGAFSRLFAYFVRQFQPASVQTFADLRWSEGKVYERNGFTLQHTTKPNYWYFKNQLKRYHRYGFRKQELAHKLKVYDQQKTEYQNMLDNILNGTGMDRIWDCGNAAYVWYA